MKKNLFASTFICILMIGFCLGQVVADSTGVSIKPGGNIFGLSVYQLGLLVFGAIELVWRVVPTTTKLTPLIAIVTILQKLFFNANNVKMIIVICLLSFTSCKTFNPPTSLSNPDISWDGKNLCVKEMFTVTVPEDSLLFYLHKGIYIGNDTNYFQLGYIKGKFFAVPRVCIKVK